VYEPFVTLQFRRLLIRGYVQVDEYEKQTGISIPIHGQPLRIKMFFYRRSTDSLRSRRCVGWFRRAFRLSRIQVGM